MSQLIISLGREFGSGGHEIAYRLAKRYNLPMYDRNLLKEIEAQGGLSSGELEAYDETKGSKLFSRTVKGMSSSPAENIAQLQFNFIKKKAASGESFVIVGRCSETLLKEYEGLVSLFILGDEAQKSERVQKIYNLSEKAALDFMKEKDRKRKLYHNSHSMFKWGDSRNYELMINSSKLGIDETVRIISEYIDAKRKRLGI